MKLYTVQSCSNNKKILNNTKFHDHIAGYDYFFTIERDKWIYTDSLEDSEIVIISWQQLINNPELLDCLSKDQIALIWIFETVNDGDNPKNVRKQVKKIDAFNRHERIIVVHSNQLDNSDPRFISNDIMFNREKLYFTEYDDSMCSMKYWLATASKDFFTLSKINKNFSNTSRSFLVPNRIITNTIIDDWDHAGIKSQLQKFLTSINSSMYISDPTNGVILKSNGWDDSIHSQTNPEQWGFWPIGDFFYENSYVTVGIETIHFADEIFYPSEKYFDHFIKGNFPLMFSGYKTIDNLKSRYNFKFPNWIDYSYDDIREPKDRFFAYLESVKKISLMPLIKLHKCYLRDKDILEHNRNIFFTKPYDSLYDKVKDSIQKLGWNFN